MNSLDYSPVQSHLVLNDYTSGVSLHHQHQQQQQQQQPDISVASSSRPSSCDNANLANVDVITTIDGIRSHNYSTITATTSASSHAAAATVASLTSSTEHAASQSSTYRTIIPSAHNSVHHQQQQPLTNGYSQPHTKNFQLESNQSSSSSSSSSNMALNFTHDLSHQTQSVGSSHRGQHMNTDQLLQPQQQQQHHQQQQQHPHLGQPQNSSSGENFKTSINCLDTDQSSCVAHSSGIAGAGVDINMWKDHLGIGNFKQPSSDPNHNFNPTDFNPYPWKHGNPHFSHQPPSSSSLTQHHPMIGYSHHQYNQHHHHHHHRSSLGSLSQSHDLVIGPSGSLNHKDSSLTSSMQHQQNNFMLSPTLSTSAANHHHHNLQEPHNGSGPVSNLMDTNQHQLQQSQQLTSPLRSNHQLVAQTGYQLSDGQQLYAPTAGSASSRVDSRTHLNMMDTKNPSLIMNETLVQMSLGAVGLAGGNQSQFSTYQSIVDHANIQPSSSSHPHHHHMAASSSAGPKSLGSFKCNNCNETFALRNAYQAHLKTHLSLDKGNSKSLSASLSFVLQQV